VLTNLVGNAIKFTPCGEVEVRVTIDSHALDAWLLHFCIRDTGIGVPMEKHQAIFEAFNQADMSTTRKYGGTGLGLSICSKLAQMMEGRLWVESQPGAGSAFHFTGLFGLSSAPAARPLPAPACLKGTRVLVVDDNATNLQILHERLTNWQMIPETVADAAAAFKALLRPPGEFGPFSLVITDDQMPGQDGFMLVNQIQQYPTLKEIPIIMLTSGYQYGDHANRAAQRLIARLVKPVAPNALLDALMLAVEANSTPAPHAKAIRNAPSAPAVTSLRVLLVEDNPINQRVGTALLSRLGQSVEVVGDGLQAVVEIQAKDYDLVLMDIEMPVMDGWTATTAIRALEESAGSEFPLWP
jgi:two-component system sensor histidine kinase/response regulator